MIVFRIKCLLSSFEIGMTQDKYSPMVHEVLFCSQYFLMFEVYDIPSSAEQIVHHMFILLAQDSLEQMQTQAPSSRTFDW